MLPPLGLPRRSLAIALGLALALGCNVTTYVGDAPSGDTDPEVLTLAFVTPGPVAMPFGTTTSLEVALTDGSGTPRAAELVSFALDGMPADSTLSALEDDTDSNGVATVMLHAGDRAATYRVRANHPNASPVWLDVTVAASFGRLVVSPTWDGAPVESWSVVLFDGLDCAAAPTASGGITRVVAADSLDGARFDALPTDRTFTAFVRGLVADRTVATGCRMGIGVLADTETTALVPVSALPLALSGGYELSLAIDASAALAPLSGFSADASLRAGTAADDAARLFAALDGTLGADGRLALGRLGVAGELLLTGLLVADDSAPSTEVGPALLRAAESLAHLRYDADLTIGAGDVPTLTALRWLADETGASPLVLDGVPLDGALLATSFAPDTSSWLVDRLSLGLPLTAALAAAVMAEARAASLGGPLDRGTCDTLDRFVEAQTELASTCDAACRAAACATALEATLTAALDDGGALDASRSRFELSGTLEAHDDDRDLSVDRLGGTLEGHYGADGATEGGAAQGVVAAARPFG